MAKYAENGERYERLLVIEAQALIENGHRYSLCQCDCGKQKIISDTNLKKGKSKSCGCLAKEVTSSIKKKHGMSGTKIYMTWNRMLTRCNNKKIERYGQYGGRGIKVCKRWENFENFYNDMGDIPSNKHSLGRIDNDADYCQENCRWETVEQQMSNTSRNVFIEHNGERKTVMQWSAHYQIDYSKLMARHNMGIKPPMLFETIEENMTVVEITVDGVTKKTTEWMKFADIPISSFYYHQRKGRSKEWIVKNYLLKKRQP